MSSASLPADAREALEGYLAGRLKAERVVVTVAEAYYKVSGARQNLRPVLEVIERAAPGVVALGRIEGGAGFDIKLAERPFPKNYEAALRTAVENALSGEWGTPPKEREALSVQHETPSKPGLLSRLIGAVRRLFSAST